MNRHSYLTAIFSLFSCISLASQSIILPNQEQIALTNLVAVFEEDVFTYFIDETHQYDTALKRELFKKTEEYANYFDKLEQLKILISNSEVEYELPLGEFSLSDYQLDTKAFLLTTVGTYYWDENRYHILHNNIIAANLEFEKIKSGNSFMGGFKYAYQIPCAISEALDVENARNSVLRYSLTINIIGTIPIPSEIDFSRAVTGLLVNVTKITIRNNDETVLAFMIK